MLTPHFNIWYRFFGLVSLGSRLVGAFVNLGCVL